tara:strand:- start:2199 stop:2528 length:330 start_codon:yes stop_codon:yes gene_type:complete
MGSIYNNTTNIYWSEFKSMDLTDSGTFSFPSDEAKQVQIFNDAGYKIRVYKTDSLTATTSGTSNSTGVWLGLEDGSTYDINGIGNANHVSIQKDSSANPTFAIKYILSK